MHVTGRRGRLVTLVYPRAFREVVEELLVLQIPKTRHLLGVAHCPDWKQSFLNVYESFFYSLASSERLCFPESLLLETRTG